MFVSLKKNSSATLLASANRRLARSRHSVIAHTRITKTATTAGKLQPSLPCVWSHRDRVVLENYRQENRRKQFKAYNRGFKLIQNVKKLGMSEANFVGAAEEFGFLATSCIMTRHFEPVNIDEDIVKDISEFLAWVAPLTDGRCSSS